MLQYPSASVFSRPIDTTPDYFRRNNDPLTSKRIPPKDARQPFAGLPPPIATNISTSNSPSSSSPSTASSKLPRSPYISSRQTSSTVPLPVSRYQSKSRPTSPVSVIDDVFMPGDAVGDGSLLQGEPIRVVPLGSNPRVPEHEEPAKEFEVVRRLGAGSYAVVYLVLEVLYRPPPSADGHILVGQMDSDDIRRPGTVYGREYAIKCLSKANLDEEALAAQMSEVTIHQSLRSHPNIVTHHRTLETSSFLLLLLEYVPGEDLFYFLEQARDHYDSDTPSSNESHSTHTPPTPSLLSNLNPSQLLSRTRLRLISSMFSQMCDAVAACHDQTVFHRDIKPENFIVTDCWVTSPDGRPERKVVVKLTDFGLSTTEIESSDMDCGSAPYMSYECRNNVAPTYRPRAADVWSLGIVFINMLYHYNPWTDTAQGACSSFDLFCQQPVNFFMQRFAGMTLDVADLLANRVFNILDTPNDDSQRLTAAEFGIWVRDLPDLIGEQPPPAIHMPSHKRVISISSTTGHPIASSMPASHRPSSRQASTAIKSRTHSRNPSVVPALVERLEASELSTVLDQDLEEENEEPEEILIEGMTSRSTSTNKRRKRGARKGKGSVPVPATPKDETLEVLADASQSLAREISKASKASSRRSAKSSSTTESARARRAAMPYEPVSLYALPKAMCTGAASATDIPPVPPVPAMAVVPTPVTKKPSKWKLSFGKSSASHLVPPPDRAFVLDDSGSPLKTLVDVGTATAPSSSPASMSATASNITSLLMGLNAPPPQPAPLSSNSLEDLTGSLAWSHRGRRDRAPASPPSSTFPRRTTQGAFSPSPHHSVERLEPWGDGDRVSNRGNSPHSTRSSRLAHGEGNWRSSMSTTSSAGTSTSAFTHYSNSSLRSVSTTATSVSATSWRSKAPSQAPSQTPSQASQRPPGVPRNIKIMDGVPWELSLLPREQHIQPTGDIFGSPPTRKPPRIRKPKDQHLGTINEQPVISATKLRTPDFPRQDASTSTTDLDEEDEEWGNKKVQRGQINALAKMLSALRR